MKNRKKYPKNWKALSTACKNRAGWKCERCNIAHRTLRLSYSGNLYPVYMQAAHVNHDPHNPNPTLICVCPSCHWRYYRNVGHMPVWMFEQRKHRILLQKRGYKVPA
jgi:hypothetical protein